MDYRVVQDYVINELGVTLHEGEQVRDGDCDPDLMAELVSKGVIEPMGGFVLGDGEGAEADADEATLSDEEPARRARRGKQDEEE